MKRQPLISVIIPSYNHEKFLGEAIQSVINQDYKNIELIIIDDGSNDNSISIIEKFKDICKKRFTRFEFRHRPNKGLCATLNEALAWSQGKYFTALASDDIWENTKTTIQTLYLEKNNSCLGVFGNVQIIDSTSLTSKHPQYPYKKYTFSDIFLHKHYLPASSALCRTELIKAVGGYDLNVKIEDWYMWLKLTEKNGSLDYLPINFAFYRQHNSNTSSNTKLMHEERLKILEMYKNHPLYHDAKFKIFRCCLNETSSFHSNLFINALKVSPLFLIKGVFWKNLLRILSSKKNKGH